MSGFSGFLVIVGGLALLRLTKYQLRSDPSGKQTIVTTTIIAFGLMATGILLMLQASASDYANGLFVTCVLPALMMTANELLLKMIASDIGTADRLKRKRKPKSKLKRSGALFPPGHERYQD